MSPQDVTDEEIEKYILLTLKQKREEYEGHRLRAMVDYENNLRFDAKEWERLYHRYVQKFDAAIKAAEESFKK